VLKVYVISAFDLHAATSAVFCFVLMSLFKKFSKDRRDSEMSH